MISICFPEGYIMKDYDGLMRSILCIFICQSALQVPVFRCAWMCSKAAIRKGVNKISRYMSAIQGRKNFLPGIADIFNKNLSEQDVPRVTNILWIRRNLNLQTHELFQWTSTKQVKVLPLPSRVTRGLNGVKRAFLKDRFLRRKLFIPCFLAFTACNVK